ncbi:MAG: EamA family transporter [Pseudomonadota bacterium]
MDSLAANPFAFALVAALLWALSSPVISQALRLARTTASPPETVVIGLNLAILVGAALLTAIRGLPDAGLLTEPFVILAGLLTFPVGTGLYYVASVWYRNRAALAAQFANVKPLITIPAGLMFFDETLDGTSVLAAVCITLGIAVIIYGAARKHTSFGAMSFGLFLALSWGIGEVSVRTAAMQSARFDIAHASLVASIPVAIFAWAAIRVMRRGTAIAWPPRKAAAAFVMHGALSFAGAYFFFFASISTHGLSHTVLITTAWPTLAIALSTLWDRDTLRNLSTELMIAMGLFTLGSVVHVAGTAF